MDRRHRWLKHAPVGGGVVLMLVLVSALVWMIHGFMANKDQKPQRMVQNITIIRPPPPPPEQPPPPPPEKIEQQIAQNEPEPTPDNAPPQPSQQLGLDADGSAGDDGFGLAAHKGGSDLVGTGGAVFAWYQRKIQNAITDRLSADNCLHAKIFTADLRVRIDANGHIKIEDLVKSTGDHRVDGCITADLSSGVNADESPPIEFPRLALVKIVQRS